MYLDESPDFKTVWQLAHNWAGKESHASDPSNLSQEIKIAIHRVMIAIRNKLISVRAPSGVIFADEGFFATMFEISHYLKFGACLRKNHFDKEYLNSLSVWKPEVIRWCINDQLPIPPVWQHQAEPNISAGDETEEGHWYTSLSERRKRIAGILHIAAELWKSNKSLSYEEVWNHEDMKKYDKPRSFVSLESFKEWTRDIAPQEAKTPGRRKYSV
jgi:hypothetical protein